MDHRWRKARGSGPNNQCVELAYPGLVRDSKNPAGPVLRVNLALFLASVRTLPAGCGW